MCKEQRTTHTPIPTDLPRLFAVVIHPGPDEPDAVPRIVKVAEHADAANYQSGFNDVRRDGRMARIVQVVWRLADDEHNADRRERDDELEDRYTVREAWSGEIVKTSMFRAGAEGLLFGYNTAAQNDGSDQRLEMMLEANPVFSRPVESVGDVVSVTTPDDGRTPLAKTRTAKTDQGRDDATEATKAK